jgi:hypothetical protein
MSQNEQGKPQTPQQRDLQVAYLESALQDKPPVDDVNPAALSATDLTSSEGVDALPDED